MVSLVATTSRVSQISSPFYMCASRLSHSTIIFVSLTLTWSICESIVVPAADPCDSDSFFELVGLADSPHTFQMKAPAGTSVMIYVDDTTGAEGWSGAVRPFHSIG